jgi:hypothetical protein
MAARVKAMAVRRNPMTTELPDHEISDRNVSRIAAASASMAQTRVMADQKRKLV